MKPVLACILFSWVVLLASAQEPGVGRARDAYQKPVAITREKAGPVILSIKNYKAVLESKDYGRFYLECTHTVLRKRVTQQQFTNQIAGVADLLGKFFDDVLAAYEAKGVSDDDFQIGEMPYPLIPGTFIIQFADRIDARPTLRWPKGDPVRIQMALDGDRIRFYDLD